MVDKRRESPGPTKQEPVVVLRGVLATRPASYDRHRRVSSGGRRARIAAGLRRGSTLAWTGLVHLVLLVALAEIAWLVMPEREDEVLEVRLARESSTLPAVAEAVPPPLEKPTIPELPEEPLASVNETPKTTPPRSPSPVAAPPAIVPITSLPISSGPMTSLSPLREGDLDIGGGDLANGRSYSLRQAALERYGGTEASEDAVQLGLQWLAVHQSEDGGWSANGYWRKCPRGSGCGIRRGDRVADAGVTGLALLAFLGGGHFASDGPYEQTVQSAIDWLLRRQDAAGYFFDSKAGRPPTASMYSHGICAYALAEAYALDPQPHLREPLTRALAATARAQKSHGGWNYTVDPGDRLPEVTLSVWQIMALYSAREAGIEIPRESLDRAAKFLARQSRSDGGVRYATNEATSGATAGAWFARSMLLKTGDRSFDRGMEYLEQEFEEATPDLGNPETWGGLYTWYYRTLAAFRHQGSRWREWNRVLRPFLVSLQRTKGCAAGSWLISDYRVGGTVYATALCVMTLEVYYRYPPRDLEPTPLEVVRMLTDRGIDGPTARERSRMVRRKPETPEEAKARRKRVTRDALRELRSELPERRYVAARVLSDLGNTGVLEEMIAAADRESGRLKGAHLRFIGRLNGPGAIAYLVLHVDHADPDVREGALSALRSATGLRLADAEAWKVWAAKRSKPVETVPAGSY